MPSRSLERNKSSSRYVGGVLVVLLHVVIVSALLQIASVRSRAAEVAPVFVKLITPATPLVEPAPPPPAPKKICAQTAAAIYGDGNAGAFAHSVGRIFSQWWNRPLLRQLPTARRNR